MKELKFGNHRVSYSARERVLLSLAGEPVAELRPGTGTINIRNGEGKLEIDPPKAKVTLTVVSKGRRGEATDAKAPPAPPTPPNYLAELREAVRRSMGVTREAFADHKSIYEVVDDLDKFEEEREAEAKERAKKNKKEREEKARELEELRQQTGSQDQVVDQGADPGPTKTGDAQEAKP